MGQRKSGCLRAEALTHCFGAGSTRPRFLQELKSSLTATRRVTIPKSARTHVISLSPMAARSSWVLPAQALLIRTSFQRRRISQNDDERERQAVIRPTFLFI